MSAVTGTAAGVPYIAFPPITARQDAPVVVAWHLLDPPRTETAFAAAVPLDGLDAWRIYLGLPMSGSRLPEGGFAELVRLAGEDAVLNLHGPVVLGAAEEFAAAWPVLRERLGLGDGPLGVMGGSMGSAVAQFVVAEGGFQVAAAVLISPVVDLRAVVTALSKRYEMTYTWSPESDRLAERLDFTARSLGDTALLYVVGEEDDAAGFHEPPARVPGARVETVAGMEHALADEPGMEPAPQSPHAAAVDRLAVDWFSRHLVANT
ncbi:alpha/beta hydrolase family protein [Nonomuraea sp. NPDC050556]|uniref:alpha/beta hydrolase family protein n=1 Tax=Nonomuraea sp. NPDC050556 TaxID=3364369 RepID=UPI003789DC1E